MVYDYATDIKYITGMSDIDNALINWSVDQAKTIYIADDPTNYDDDDSQVDNRLVSILASGFVNLNFRGIPIPTSFKLDEFEVSEEVGSNEENKYFLMFFDWLNFYLKRGVSLNYKDTEGVILLSDYDPTIYIIDRTATDGVA